MISVAGAFVSDTHCVTDACESSILSLLFVDDRIDCVLVD